MLRTVQGTCKEGVFIQTPGLQAVCSLSNTGRIELAKNQHDSVALEAARQLPTAHETAEVQKRLTEHVANPRNVLYGARVKSICKSLGKPVVTDLTIRLPNPAHQKIRQLTKRNDVSVNLFIASVTAENMASFLTLAYLVAESAKGQRSNFEHHLRSVPDTPAVPGVAMYE